MKIKMNGFSENVINSVGKGFLLANVMSNSKVFHLKAFSNPREFFISIIQDVAHRNHVVYEKV